MSSIASEVSATLASQASQWSQSSAAAQGTDTQSFAALLDANTAAPDVTGQSTTTTTQAPPGPNGPAPPSTANAAGSTNANSTGTDGSNSVAAATGNGNQTSAGTSSGNAAPPATNRSETAPPAPQSGITGAKTASGNANAPRNRSANWQDHADSAAATAQADAAAPTYADHADARSTDPSTASSTRIAAESSNPPGGPPGAKPDGSGLPNFGFSIAATTATAARSVSPGTTSNAASVPVAGLAVAIAARAQSGSNQLDIRLDPAEPGRIDVRLDVDGDGQVTTHVTADRADTLELLQSQQPQIQQALEQAGLKTADNGLQFSLRDQSFAGQNNGSGYQSSNTAQLVIPNATPIAATQIYARAGLGSGVDISV